jgi:hypothetical protein
MSRRNRSIRISDEMIVLGYLEYNARCRAGDYNKTADDVLKELTKKPMRVIWRAMHRACNRQFIEFGVSLRTGWPTREGLALLDRAAEELRAVKEEGQ